MNRRQLLRTLASLPFVGWAIGRESSESKFGDIKIKPVTNWKIDGTKGIESITHDSGWTVYYPTQSIVTVDTTATASSFLYKIRNGIVSEQGLRETLSVFNIHDGPDAWRLERIVAPAITHISKEEWQSRCDDVGIYDWENTGLPTAKIYDANGKGIENVCQCDIKTGRVLKRDEYFVRYRDDHPAPLKVVFDKVRRNA